MTSFKGIVAGTVLFGTVMTAHALVPQQPAAPQSTPAASPGGALPTGPGRGGRGNAAATLFTETCAGCHGTDLAGGRAPSLFDETWLHGSDDASIEKNIREGFPAAGMISFKDTLTDQQIWQLVAYIRTPVPNLNGRPQYVPDPTDQVIKSEKPTF